MSQLLLLRADERIDNAFADGPANACNGNDPLVGERSDEEQLLSF